MTQFVTGIEESRAEIEDAMEEIYQADTTDSQRILAINEVSKKAEEKGISKETLEAMKRNFLYCYG